MINKVFMFIVLVSFATPNNKLKSLILPGWGEISSGKNFRGQVFLGSEIMLWIGLLGGNNLSKQYQSDYTGFAIEHADVNWDKTDYLFAVDLGYYESLSNYNSEKRRQRSLKMRTLPSGEVVREFGYDVYPENGDFYWNWDSKENRVKYNDLRVKSVLWGKVNSFAIAGLILNRVASFIDVLFLERSRNEFGATSKIEFVKDEKVKLIVSIPLDFSF